MTMPLSQQPPLAPEGADRENPRSIFNPQSACTEYAILSNKAILCVACVSRNAIHARHCPVFIVEPV
jgi:hypothetical protein